MLHLQFRTPMGVEEKEWRRVWRSSLLVRQETRMGEEPPPASLTVNVRSGETHWASFVKLSPTAVFMVPTPCCGVAAREPSVFPSQGVRLETCSECKETLASSHLHYWRPAKARDCSFPAWLEDSLTGLTDPLTLALLLPDLLSRIENVLKNKVMATGPSVGPRPADLTVWSRVLLAQSGSVGV